MPMNPISCTYAVNATGSQTAFGLDWRDAPTGLSYLISFDSGASGSVTVDTTLDNLNDPSGSVVPVWTSSSAITTTTLASVPSPAQFIRVTIGSLSGGTLTFKILQGAPDGGGSSSGGGGGGAVTIADGADTAEGATTAAAYSDGTGAAAGTVVGLLKGLFVELGTKITAVSALPTGGVGIIGWLSRLYSQLPATLGQTTKANSLAVTLPSDMGSLAVTPASQGYGSSVSITRPANTTAYAASTVVGGVQSLASIGPSAGGQVMITSALFNINDTALISGEGSYYLAIYSASPGSAYADGAAWGIPSGDRTSFLGLIPLGTPVVDNGTLSVSSDIINKQVTLASGTLYAYLITNGAYTPTASRVYVVALHSVAL